MYSVVQEIESYCFILVTLPLLSNTIMHIHNILYCCCLLVVMAVCIWCACTWPLLRGAGNYPLDETTLHQRFTREPRSLPLGAVGLPARVGIRPVGIGQHAAIRGLSIRLRETENERPSEREREKTQDGPRGASALFKSPPGEHSEKKKTSYGDSKWDTERS